MELEITPHLGVGRVTFQMTKAEVQHVLGVATREFLRSEDSVGPEWEYRNRGIIVSFDATGVCDSLQLSDPCDPVLQGVHLLSMGGAAAMESLRRLDPDATLQTDTLVSFRLGVNICAPEADTHPDWPASGILVFRPDYYGS